jgi:hypothetical protein
VDGTACIHVRADVGYPLAVTGDEYPHRYTYRWQFNVTSVD